MLLFGVLLASLWCQAVNSQTPFGLWLNNIDAVDGIYLVISHQDSEAGPEVEVSTTDPSTEPTVEPPPECAGFTPIVGAGFSPQTSEIISETTANFEDCCSQVPNRAGSFSHSNGTCSYYHYWVNVTADPSVTISDDTNDFTLYVNDDYQEPTCKLDKYSKEIISNEDTFQKEFALSSGTTKIWFKCKDGTIFHVSKTLADNFGGLFISTGFIYSGDPSEEFSSSLQCKGGYPLFYSQITDSRNPVDELFDLIDFLPERLWVWLSRDGTTGEYLWTTGGSQQPGVGWVRDAAYTEECVVFETNKENPGFRDISCDTKNIPGLCYIPYNE